MLSVLVEKAAAVAKKLVIVIPLLILALLIAIAVFSPPSSAQPQLTLSSQAGGVVDKNPSGNFTVTLGLKNTGTGTGTFTVLPVFEGDSWTWKGTPQTVTLDPGKSKTVSWYGQVPDDAPVDSIARLVVYYGNSYTALNWWIHVASAAQLSITQSNVA